MCCTVEQEHEPGRYRDGVWSRLQMLTQQISISECVCVCGCGVYVCVSACVCVGVGVVYMCVCVGGWCTLANAYSANHYRCTCAVLPCSTL